MNLDREIGGINADYASKSCESDCQCYWMIGYRVLYYDIQATRRMRKRAYGKVPPK